VNTPAAASSISSITGDRNRHIDSEELLSEELLSNFPGANQRLECQFLN
jgi:hypothetical protein